MARPDVTIITAAYNVEAYIGEAVTSVLCQTTAQWRYVIIDDGSEDATVDRALDAAGGDPRVEVVRRPHLGSAAARNHGLGLVDTPLVVFLDADDRWLEDKLVTQIEALGHCDPGVAGVFCGSYLIDWQGHRTGKVIAPFTGPCGLEEMLVRHCPPGNGSSVLLRTTSMDQAGAFDEQLPSAVDFEMWCRIAAACESPAFYGSAVPLVEYRGRKGNISSNWPARRTAIDEIVHRYVGRLPPDGQPMAWVVPALHAFQQDDDACARRWGAEAIKAGPIRLVRGSPESRRFLLWYRAGPTVTRAMKSALSRLGGRRRAPPT